MPSTNQTKGRSVPKDLPLSTADFHFSINDKRHCCVL